MSSPSNKETACFTKGMEVICICHSLGIFPASKDKGRSLFLLLWSTVFVLLAQSMGEVCVGGM